MANIFSIYPKLLIKSITYESGDSIVSADCVVEDLQGNSKPALIHMTHTDLNRIIAQLIASGFEFQTSASNSYFMEDGTEIIDYSFENVYGDSVVLEQFEFVNTVKEIRA